MTKKKISLIAMLLVICMAFAACGGKEDDTKEGDDKKTTEESSSKDESKDTADTGKTVEDLKLGCNNFMKGIYSVDILENGFAETCKALGIDTMIVNDEGKVEKTVQNVDNMISAGVDGIVFFGISETLFPVVSQKCEDAKIPFVCYDHMPSEENLEILLENPYFKGAVATKDYGTGQNIGEHAGSKGLKKAIVVTGKKTDPTHSARTEGFKEAFEAAGGKVLDIAWDASNLSDSNAKANDLLTAHPDADCVYATNGDFGSGTMQAMAQHTNVNAKLYVTDLDPDVLTGLKDGTISAANGAHWINVDFATTLLVNALLGHELKTEDGKAPILVAPVMALPSEMVDLYDEFWIKSQPFSGEELKQLVSAWKEEVSLKDYTDVLKDYTVESRLKQKEKEGLITAEELEAVGIK
jgi:ribose transport system substrate-binding protein